MMLPRRAVLAFRLLGCLLALFAGIGPACLGQTLQVEALKANYLIGFIDFVRWENVTESDSVTIGVQGSAELVRLLQNAANEKGGKREVKIVRIQPDREEDLERFHVLYLQTGSRKGWKELYNKCKSRPILLVSDNRQAISNGAAIQFVFTKNRLRFRISPQNASSHGIEISSSLIEIALPLE